MVKVYFKTFKNNASFPYIKNKTRILSEERKQQQQSLMKLTWKITKYKYEK